MNLKYAGLVVGSIGVFLLTISLILGAVMGANSRTMEKFNNDYDWDDQPSKSTERKVEKAQEANAFLGEFNSGLVSLSLGLIAIGGGLAIAKQKRGGWFVLGLSIAAALVLVIGFFITIYLGAIESEAARLDNKDDPSEEDEKRVDEISENREFLFTFNQFLSGFLFGSLGIGLALMTIPLAAFLEPMKPDDFFKVQHPDVQRKDAIDLELDRMKAQRTLTPQPPAPPPAPSQYPVQQQPYGFPPPAAPPQQRQFTGFPPPQQQQYGGFPPPQPPSSGTGGIDDLFR